MLGAIIGDIIGSSYEFNNIKTTEFPLFSGASHITDDTVMTLAVAEGLMNGCAGESAAEAHIVAAMKKYGSTSFTGSDCASRKDMASKKT